MRDGAVWVALAVVRWLGLMRFAMRGRSPWFLRWLPEEVYDEAAMEYVDRVIHEHRREEAAKKAALSKRLEWNGCGLNRLKQTARQAESKGTDGNGERHSRRVRSAADGGRRRPARAR